MDNNKDFFFSILNDHKGIIYKIANSYCKDREDRKDLIQEISVQIWLSLDKYDEQFKLSTWLYRIGLNTAISFYRKNKTRKEKTVEWSSILDNTLNWEEPLPENSDLSLLQQFIQELSEIDKALILLYLEGLNHKEIAAIIGITSTNVSTKVLRIKKTLKNKFKKSQDHERR